MAPERRQSIHRDVKMTESATRNDEILVTCQECKQPILYNKKTNTESELNEEDLKQWKKILKNKTGVYPEIEDVPFTCQKCDPTEARNDHEMIVPASLNAAGAGMLLGPPGVVSSAAFVVPWAWVLIGVSVCVGIIYKYIPNSEGNYYNPASFAVNFKQSEIEKNLDDTFYELENKYTEQVPEVWDTITAGVKAVVRSKPNQPAVFLMLYESNSAGQTAKCIAQDASDVAIPFLMRKKHRPVLVEGRELNQEGLIEDPGLLLVQYNDTVRSAGAMIVTNLQDVSPKVVTSFHFFCDKYTPLIETAVYFFTLNVDTKLPRVKLGEVAVKRLTALWSGKMEEHKMSPLITRLTGSVIKITSDSANC